MSERAAPIPPRRGWLAGLRLLGLLALPVLFLELCARLGEAQPAPTASPIRPLFLVGAALIATLGRPIREAPHSWRLPWAGLALLAGAALTGRLYAATGSTIAAWGLALDIWAGAIWLLAESGESPRIVINGAGRELELQPLSE